MSRRPTVPLVAAIACLLAAGCGGADTPSPSASRGADAGDPADRDDGASPVSADDLDGTTWVVEGLVTGADERPATSSDGGLPSLVFADGTVTGTDGCNRLGAEYTVAGDELEVGGLSRTEMACLDDGQGGHVASVLEGTSTIAVTEDGVTLTDGDLGLALRISRDEAPETDGLAGAPEADGLAGALDGTTWVLERITDAPNGGPDLELAPDANEAVLELGTDGRAVQGSGCLERDDVRWTITGTELRSTYESAIDYDCRSDELWQQDTWVWRVLHADPTVSLDGDALILSDADRSLHYRSVDG